MDTIDTQKLAHISTCITRYFSWNRSPEEALAAFLDTTEVWQAIKNEKPGDDLKGIGRAVRKAVPKRHLPECTDFQLAIAWCATDGILATRCEEMSVGEAQLQRRKTM